MVLSPGLIAGLTGLAGGLLGKDAGRSRANEDALRALAANVEGIQVPELYESEITIEDLIALDLIDPEDAQALEQDPSAFAEIVGDDTVKAAYMDALEQWRSLASEGGLSDTDKMRLSDIENRMARKERGAREAILQGAHERGVGGSGLELAQQLISQQEAAGRRSQEGLDVAARSEQRVLEALARQEGLAKDIRGQDFSEASKKASAEDIISKFNTQDARRVRDENIARSRAAAEKEWANRQRVGEANVMRRQKDDERMVNARQQQYQNQIEKAKAAAGIRAGAGKMEGDRRAQEGKIYGGTLGTVGTILNRGYGKKAAIDYGVDKDKDLSKLLGS
jgi:hypothetical protein